MQPTQIPDQPASFTDGIQPVPLKSPYLLLLVIVPLAFVFARYVYATCDDTYIFLVYAKNFLEGDGLTYNGARVEGYTSGLWLALIILGGLMGGSLPAVAEFLSMASGLFLLCAVIYLGRACALSPARGVLAAVLVAATGDIAFYAVSGMETVLFAALLILATAVAISRPPEALLRSFHFPALLILTTLARPEGALASAVIISYLGIRASSWQAFARCCVFCIAMYLPILIARYAYYGYVFPNTYYAKGNVGFGNVHHGVEYVAHAIPRFSLVLLPCALLFAYNIIKGDRGALRDVALPIALTLVLSAYVVIIGGDFLIGVRFLVPMLPLLYVTLIRQAHFLPTPAATAATLIIAASLPLTFLRNDAINSDIDLWRYNTNERRAIADYLRDEFPPDTLIALNPAGIIPYETAMPTIDMMGLNDEHIAHRGRRDLNLPYAHQIGDGDYILSRNPSVILFGAFGTKEPTGLVSDMEIYERSEFHDGYTAKQLPNGAWMYVRK